MRRWCDCVAAWDGNRTSDCFSAQAAVPPEQPQERRLPVTSHPSCLCPAALTDGAEENWRYFEKSIYDQTTKIVDHGHASQHLRAAMAAYYGEQSVVGRAEYERLRIILRDQPGGADDVIAALSRLARKTCGKKNKRCRKLLNAELTSFTNQRERLDYAEYQARGLPIGSGMVEATCKALATQRLKRSGMSWRDGKQAILTVRRLQ
jgi:hypothetical protein